MSFIPTWRETLTTTAPLFAPLLKEDISLNLLYGLCAGALLWCVRDLPSNPDIQQAVRDVGAETSLPFFHMIVAGWAEATPLVAARNLGSMSKGSPDLKVGLDALLVFFMDDLMAVGLIQQPKTSPIDIQGSISGANVVIGGTQVVAGDLIIQYMTPKANRICPRPSEEPVHFGGRDKQLSELMTALAKGEDCAITALKGIGGMGKTTLARVLASRLYKEKVFCAVLWADVTRNPSFQTLISSWAHYADSSFDASNQSDEQLAYRVKILLDELIAEQCEACEPSRVLVVLDDVWDNGKAVARLLMKAKPAGSTVLVTTRSESLAIDLKVQQLRSLDRMNETEAAEFLCSYLPTADGPSLKRLGQALGGHPLAMELAARRILKEQGRDNLATTLVRCIDEYEQHIPEGTPFATLKLEQGEERDDNLTGSLYYSYEGLSAADQARFRALGALAYDEPFNTALLSVLWQSQTTEDDCDTLRLLSLIERIPDQGGMYRQHPLLRSYARALLNSEYETQVTFGRYADQIIQACTQFQTLALEQWDSILAVYYPHITYVGDELVKQTAKGTLGDIQRAFAFAKNITSYLFFRRNVHRIVWLEMGLQATRTLKISEDNEFDIYETREAVFLNEIGLIYSALNQKQEAINYYQEALLLFKKTGDKRGEATALANIGKVWGDLDELSLALDYNHQALSIFREIDDLSR